MAHGWIVGTTVHLCADEAVADVLEAGSSSGAHQATRRGKAPHAHARVDAAVVQRQQRSHSSPCNHTGSKEQQGPSTRVQQGKLWHGSRRSSSAAPEAQPLQPLQLL
jgi:hypothetical protein